ncbi:serine hydrolase [Mycobacterium sp.]|uniref:serine hydrolase n=1 Tax=Mycobacterium sp. TaxID=1785 RepID=UPI003D0F3577
MREAFAENFVQGKEIGAAVAAWVDGELVVQPVGRDGRRRRLRGHGKRKHAVHRAVRLRRGLTSTCVHQLVERGEILTSNAPVARYWPASSRKRASRTSPSPW